MGMLNSQFLQIVKDHDLHADILRGKFGLEKENTRVDKDGKLALTPHPKAFGSKMENPYIKTDFSESQIEMITPAFDTIDETYNFLETLHDIVTLELHDEYLWPSSNPPELPDDEEIPIAVMNDPVEDQYRLELSRKYGRKRQLLCGIHYNFSFDEAFLESLHRETALPEQDFKDFKDAVYMKVARNLLKYRWLLIHLTGASPVFNKTYIERCVQLGDHLDEESRFFPNMNSLRNSVCGYRTGKPFYVSFNSVEEYVRDLQSLVDSNELLSVKEFYNPVRVKPAKRDDFLQDLLQNGIAYLELRMIDLNPLYKNGISKETMQFIHLFLVFMLLMDDEPFGEKEQKVAALNHDSLVKDGITGQFYGEGNRLVTLREKALVLMGEMEQMVQVLKPDHQPFIRLLELEKQRIQHPELSFAAMVKSEIQKSSYLHYHLGKARQYAKQSEANGYQFIGYEDLELSTQLLLKAAIKRGIEFELLDREDNFIVLKKGGHQEFVKQATKTSLDSYSTVLIMENKLVTKKVLKQHGIRVPNGRAYHELGEAMADYGLHRDKPIVIKPKSTNFGLGVTIFTGGCSKEDYRKAFEMAFEHDRTVLLEEFMTGREYRFLVMGGEVVGILHRVPANVVGDGIHTIEQLVDEKNKDPLRGTGYKTPLERIRLGEVEEMLLKNQSKSRTDILAKGEIVYLRENSNISTGGDSIDYTDDIPESYKRIAVHSAKAAGATFCGVDMMIDNIAAEASETNYSIIEINFNPAIHIHCYPYKGKNRKADEKILDLLFGKI
ncbi:bifunctional glutamate--cysteine ligase GshA/glutathione synthetase GshB [Ferviditalea candida]|uniref:Glutathione biosynthesis bifunctional protein GshAB n=1 Tax=Ferviditalea candida TaxID=3108399 RepID=A0ABU5ZFW7_9BACL|nr:bifunctional glutamate--cysteine ligase GshA/glutathione synthetase GshB [Paenibacillaceae bacterium T2]